MVHISLDNLWDQGLISLGQDVPRFNAYAEIRDDFRDRFVLVKLCTLKAHSAFCYVPDKLPLIFGFQDLATSKCTYRIPRC